MNNMQDSNLPEIQIELKNKALQLAEQNATDGLAQKKYNAIAKILSESNCFSYIPIERAYAMLKDLGIEQEKLAEVYSELI